MEIAFSDGIKIFIDDDKLSSWNFKRDGRVEFYMTDKFKYIVDRNVGVLVQGDGDLYQLIKRKF